MLLTALIKAELRRVLIVTLETDTSFTPNRTRSPPMELTATEGSYPPRSSRVRQRGELN